jgi:hypothetical protein
MGMLKSILRPVIPRRLRERTYPLRTSLARIPANLLCELRIAWKIRTRGEPISDLGVFDERVYSQNNEDGALAAIFAAIGTTNRYFVEFGVEDGIVCNTRLLKRRGWTGLQMDPRENNNPEVVRAFVTSENINSLLKDNGVPENFDLLSIDIDGNDFWVWKAISDFHPRVVVIEYNACIPPNESRAISYDPAFRWDGTDYFGASLLALSRLGSEKGYVLVGCESEGVNAFFVHKSLVNGHFIMKSVQELFRPLGSVHQGRMQPSVNRKWQMIQ